VCYGWLPWVAGWLVCYGLCVGVAVPLLDLVVVVGTLGWLAG
jgi:hypothetical protein